MDLAPPIDPMMDGEGRIVLHFDMDAFFASCEEARHPSVAGQPVIVGADPRDGGGRGVVVSANYAARAYGVRAAMPIGEAWRLCPGAHFFWPDHAHYTRVSGRTFEGLASSFRVEPASIDEAFIDVTGLVSWAGAEELAETIRRRVAEASGGLSCSVGAGPNSLVAKVATDHRKPGGTTVVEPARVEEFLAPLPVGRLPGIGPKTTRRLGDNGIRTVADLRAFGRERLTALFGVHGAYMADAALGRGRSELPSSRGGRKSVSEERTFHDDTRSRSELLSCLRSMVGSLEEELVRRNYWYRTVALKVRFEDFETHTKQASWRRPTGDTTPARRVVPRLLDEALSDPRRVRLLGLRFGNLVRQRSQRTLTT